MSKLVKDAEQQLRSSVISAVSKAIAAGDLPAMPLCEFNIEVPADRTNGDFSANAAMASARSFKLAPRKIAEAIYNNIFLGDTYFERCEVAGPGFLNFFLSDEYYANILKDIRSLGDDYGKSNFGKGKRVMIEFVSANPTGPMHMGNARGGALGDCLASVMDYAGFDVSREFYINDAGNQIDKFALSLDVRYLQHFLGED
ncbi:MAG: arginine--tRNA ligase, partial [Oscillospiraceae bacterium]